LNKDNHIEDRCFKNKKDLEEKSSGREMALCIHETALVAHAKSDGLLQSYTFITDSGASSCMVYDETVIVNVKPHDKMVSGNDSKLKYYIKEPTMVIPLMIMEKR
jgi:hypothetical protein